MKTIGVTLGIGGDFPRHAAIAAREVKRLLGLETVIIGDDALDRAVDLPLLSQRAVSLKCRVFEFVPADCDRVMYFDADWRPVRQWNVDEHFPDPDAIYVAPDRPYRRDVQRLSHRYGLSPHAYFNSGWMVLPRRIQPTLEAAFANYHSYPQHYNDQCVLNQVLRDDLTFVPAAYNLTDPEWWPDSATAFAMHYPKLLKVDNGQLRARNFETTLYDDPVETILRGLETTYPGSPSGDHLMELYTVAAEFAGGRALEYNTAPGQATLALALAGLDTTSYTDGPRSQYWRSALLDRYGLQAQILVDDPLMALNEPDQVDLIFWSNAQSNQILTELELFWYQKLKPAGLLVVYQINDLDLAALVSRLNPEVILVTEDKRGRQMAYLRKFDNAAESSEQILRSLDFAHRWVTDVEHIVEINQVATAYAGGTALELGGFHGHGTLALSLAGLQVTSYDLAKSTLPIRQGLLERYGCSPEFVTADGLTELDHDRTFDVVFHDADHGDHTRVELQALWDLKVKQNGLLIVHDVNMLNLDALLATLQPETTLVTEDHIGRQMAYLRKPA